MIYLPFLFSARCNICEREKNAARLECMRGPTTCVKLKLVKMMPLRQLVHYIKHTLTTWRTLALSSHARKFAETTSPFPLQSPLRVRTFTAFHHSAHVQLRQQTWQSLWLSQGQFSTPTESTSLNRSPTNLARVIMFTYHFYPNTKFIRPREACGQMGEI